MNPKNLIKMKSLTCIFFALPAIPVFAQNTDTIATQDTLESMKNVIEKTSNGSGGEFWNIVGTILMGLAALFIIAHMVYTLITTKRFREHNFDVDYFKSVRQENGKPAESSEEENQRCRELLADAYNGWSYIIEDEEGYEYRRPNKMKEIKRADKILKEVAEITPTDEDIVGIFNEYKAVVASNEARSFDGSKKIMWLGIGIGVLMSIIVASTVPDKGFIGALFTIGLFFFIPVGIYYIASFTPQFLIEKRANRGGGNVSSGLVALALGVMGSGFTVRTRYTDGTYEDDNSAHGMALMLGIFVMLVVAFTIIIWAVVNYLRNYVLYF